MTNSSPESSPEAEQRIAELEQLISSLRHDVSGALSPALLMAGRLARSPDPDVQRAAERIDQSIQRAVNLLRGTREIVPPKPAAR